MSKDKTFLDEVLESKILVDVSKEFRCDADVGLESWWEEELKENDYDKVMESLYSVEGVKEHIDSLSINLGIVLMSSRIEKGLTREDLSDISGVSERNIELIEYGDKNISIGDYEKLLTALCINYNDLLNK